MKPRINIYEMSDRRWQSFTRDSTGRTIIGVAPDAEGSKERCLARLYDREKFLSLSIEDQLRRIVDTDKEIVSLGLSDAVKLIAKIILGSS